MKHKDRVIFDWWIPKKNKFFVALFYLDMRITVLTLKPLIKKIFLKHTSDCDFIPGFRSLYWNIFAKNVFLCDWNFIDYAPIHIWNWTTISFGCTFITASHDISNFKTIITDPINIGKNVFIGTNSTILQWVTIWDNAVIAACSVVTKDVPENGIVWGNPAKIII